MVRMMESGYKRKRHPVCDFCGKMFEPDYSIKGYVKCTKCGRLFAKKHKFLKMIE